MNTLKGFAPALLLTFSALCVCARAQTPAAETEAQAPQESTDAAAPQEALAPTGAGTAGKLAKWTTATNLGNSVVTESSYRVGINSAFPSAMLQVNGPQPAPRATSGAPALALLLQTTGGKGGNTTGTTGQAGGAGAGIYLYAGPGGDAPAGSRTGDGGNIILQPGWRGGGGRPAQTATCCSPRTEWATSALGRPGLRPSCT